jgi:hypothetical protein
VSFRTPHTGPYAGRLCRVLPDGSLTPAPEVDSARAAPSVVLPPEFGRDWRYDRETVDLMTGQQIEAGHTPERAREIAVTAAYRNADGQTGRPYTPRS